MQTLPLDGAVLVTTPQLAATNVARRGGLMFRKVNVPLLGVAENMSYFVDSVGHRHDLFGSGGGAEIAEDLNLVPAQLNLRSNHAPAAAPRSPRRSEPPSLGRCRSPPKSGRAEIPASPSLSMTPPAPLP